MDKSIIFKPLDEGEIKEYADGSGKWNRYKYVRKNYAYKKRAESICSHTKNEWLELCALYNFKCCKCSMKVIGGIPCKDHIIPTVIGGTSSIKNLQPLCRECNTSKGQYIRDYR